MQTRAEPTRYPARPLEGRHVLICLLAFFGIIFAVNGVFLYQALSTYTGVVSAEPYRKGLHYNDRIEAERRQDALGWRETLTLAPSGALSIALADSGGLPVRALEVTAVVGRPSTSASDKRIRLGEVESGRYVAPLGALEPGAWLVNIEASEPGNAAPIYRLRKRLWHKQSTP